MISVYHGAIYLASYLINTVLEITTEYFTPNNKQAICAKIHTFYILLNSKKEELYDIVFEGIINNILK